MRLRREYDEDYGHLRVTFWEKLRNYTVTVVLLVLVGLLWYSELEAGSKCNAFYEGYRDGWCSLQRYSCIEPGYYPVCVEYDFNTEREAYHVGFRDGEKDRSRLY